MNRLIGGIVIWLAALMLTACGPAAQQQEVAILCYHAVGEADNSYYVDPVEFEKQLQYLQQSGYRSLTFKQAAQYLTEGNALPQKCVIITFDDGYASVYEVAYPLLKKYGFCAVHFVVVDTIGTEGHMSVAQLKELAQAGHEIGSHGYSHAILTELDDQQLTVEIYKSKQRLEELLDTQVTAFAYPGGFYSTAVLEAVEQAGYRLAVTVSEGKAALGDNLYRLKRIPVFRYHRLSDFIKLLR